MGEGKGEKIDTEREAKHKRRLNTANKLRVDGRQGRGENEESTCWDAHWVLYVSDEPRESTPKTKSILYTLYVNQFDNNLY